MQVETAVKDVPASVVFSKASLDTQLVSQGLPASEAMEVEESFRSPKSEKEEGTAATPSGLNINVHPG